ncbi:hypothetical protein BX600DRAFT_440651 [Xylariales sp. PMI_506]|nr:hypothetical protein BX600DRAFT_440651 [Xylariales sp. PMI_506]
MDQLYDYSIVCVAVCATYIAVCIPLAVIRIWVRFHYVKVTIEDYLCVTGLILWIISTAFVFPCCWNGLGAHEEHYNDQQAQKARQYFFLWETFYVWANVALKSAICSSILRLTQYRMVIQVILYFMMALLICTTIGTTVWLMTNCKPVQAMWDQTIPGLVCLPASATVIVGNTFSGVNISMDWIVAILPVLMLWRVNMELKQKLVVMGVLSLGIFASCATLVRLQYMGNYLKTDDYLYGMGPVVLWTVTEEALALAAISMMAFGPLLRMFFTSSEQDQEPEPVVVQPQRDRFFRAHGWDFSSFGKSASTPTNTTGTTVTTVIVHSPGIDTGGATESA